MFTLSCHVETAWSRSLFRWNAAGGEPATQGSREQVCDEAKHGELALAPIPLAPHAMKAQQKRLDLERIATLVAALDPDLVAIQEVDSMVVRDTLFTSLATRVRGRVVGDLRPLVRRSIAVRQP